MRELLPGPYTLVLPNPARRYPWLTGERPDTIGVRVPVLPAPSRACSTRSGCVARDERQRAGRARAPSTLDDVPERIRTAVGAELDARRAARGPVDRDRLHRRRAARAPRRGGAGRGGARARPGRLLRLTHYDPPRWRSHSRRSTSSARPGSPRSIPRSPTLLGPRARAPARPDRADRLRELHLAERARGGRLGADEQVRRGLSRASATTAAARSSTRSRSSRATARRSSSAPSTRTCSRTPARRRTWPSTSPCSSPATGCSGSRSTTAAT